jgi:hypothetical protein
MTTTRHPVARLVIACLLAVAAFAAYHFYLRGLMLDTGLTLGAVRPGKKVYRIVPLYIYWRPRLKAGVLIAATVLLSFVWWLRRSVEASATAGHGQPFRSRLWFPVTLMLWHIAVAVSVALIDGGPSKLWEPYTVHRRSDYIGAIETIVSPRVFLQDYSRLMPQLPLHCRTHPPGGPLVLWTVARFFAPGPIAASLVTIFLAALAAPAVYLLARDVLGEPSAQVAAGLFLLAPNVAAYSATSMDAVFMSPLVWSMYFLWHGRYGRWFACGLAGGVSTSIAALMTFSTSFIALWSVVVIGLTVLFDRPRMKSTMFTLAVALVASAVFYGLLNAWSGYNPLAVFAQALAGQEEAMMGRGHSSVRQSLHFAVANLIAFGFCSGLPVVLLWFRQTARELATTTISDARWLLLSFAAALLLVDVAPLYTLETERIWMFLVGFLAIGASARVTSSAGPCSMLVLAALLLQAGQTILMEVLFDWVW